MDNSFYWYSFIYCYFPIINLHYWHHNYGKISAFWGISFILFFYDLLWCKYQKFYLIEVYLKEFLPFIVILIALFTISGGVLISGNLKGTPQLNTSILFIGTILASWMGTTGASMLLIRPLIKSNKDRVKVKSIYLYFLFF